MRSKGAAGFLLLAVLFLLAAVVPVQAAPQEATASDALQEEIIEYEEPEGLVHLAPKFEWTEENRFLLSFRVTNRTNVIVPETEVVLQLSGTGEDRNLF